MAKRFIFRKDMTKVYVECDPVLTCHYDCHVYNWHAAEYWLLPDPRKLEHEQWKESRGQGGKE